MIHSLLLIALLSIPFHSQALVNDGEKQQNTPNQMELIRPSEDNTHFVGADSGVEFTPWGFNYDHDEEGRLLEDYWYDEWPTVVDDFKEMKSLGANTVRIHLQFPKFMKAPNQPNQKALKQLRRLVSLAEKVGLYLDLTGLGCYHKQDVPAWYDSMSKTERWNAQAIFWEAIAKSCADSPAIFCYDLMNEPILPGAKKQKESEWLAGELGGKYFVQRITLDLAGRSRKQVAKAWVDKLVKAIRKHDKNHMITLGIIPWAFHFYPNAQKPLFYSEEVGENLDFTSVHFYPKKNEVDIAFKALSAYDLGKPLVIEEMFPLKCGFEEMEQFIDGSRKIADGWITFYWGKTIEDYANMERSIATAIKKKWLEYFKAKSPEMTSKQ